MRLRTIGTALAVMAGLLVATGPAHAADLDTFHGQSPQRVLDTRDGGSTVDGSASGIGAVPAGRTIHAPVISRAGGAYEGDC